MRKLSEVLKEGLSYKDEHFIEITRDLTLTCMFNLKVGYEGGEPCAFTDTYFVLENSEDEHKIIFRSDTDIEADFNVDYIHDDIITINITKLRSNEENASELSNIETLCLTLAETRRLIRAATQLQWMAYYMYTGTEEVMKLVDTKVA